MLCVSRFLWDSHIGALPRNSELMLRVTLDEWDGAIDFATDHQLGLHNRSALDFHWAQPLPMAFKPAVSVAQVRSASAVLSVSSRRSVGAALLGRALEVHLARRLSTDDEKGLRAGIDVTEPLDSLLAVAVEATAPSAASAFVALALAATHILHDQPPLVLRAQPGDGAGASAAHSVLRQFPLWLHLVSLRRLRDARLVLRVQNIDSAARTLDVAALLRNSRHFAWQHTTLSGLEAVAHRDNKLLPREVRTFVLTAKESN